MFFIIGISSSEKKLKFDQLEVCKYCGKFGHIEVFMTYTYFMFFFIPLVKWNKKFYVKMDCCNTVCEIAPELGKAIAGGEEIHLSMDMLHSKVSENGVMRCTNCGYTTTEDFKFCPKCGKSL